jgi:Spy/CpxP family protein refolding chaperone
MSRWFHWIVPAAIAWLIAAPVAAQERGADATQDNAVSPAEIQRLFDAYALMHAQAQLKLSDDQYSQFLPRFKALQDTRRRAVGERVRLLQNLRRLTSDPQSDENAIRDQVKALHELEARTVDDVRKAHDAVDQILDPRQQARFRIFEENMERRKLELVARARQANRARKPQ